MENKELREKGLAIRREVLGEKFVERVMAKADDFDQPLQDFVNEYCFGAGWGRPGLPRKIRSMLNLAMLTALNRPQELKGHVRGALRNGCSKQEIQEVLLQATIYCGIPAGVGAFRAAKEALAEHEAEK